MTELGSVLGDSLSFAHCRQDNGTCKTKAGYCTAEKCRQRAPLVEISVGSASFGKYEVRFSTFRLPGTAWTCCPW